MPKPDGLFLSQFSLYHWSRQLFSCLSTSEAVSLHFEVMYMKNVYFKQKTAPGGSVGMETNLGQNRFVGPVSCSLWGACFLRPIPIPSLSLSLVYNPTYKSLMYVRFHSTVLPSTWGKLN